MPIILNNSNIEIQYNTGSSYIIETVKSDLYVRGTTSGNLSSEPTATPTVTTNLAVFTHSGGTENQTPHTIYFPENTVCEILVVGGGGAGGNSMGGGGGAGGVVYTVNQTLQAGSYTINVGKGGQGLQLLTDGQGTVGVDQDGKDSFIQLNGTDVILSMGGVNQNLRGKGGGGGGIYFDLAFVNGRNGGSGGGCSESNGPNNNHWLSNTPGSATQGNTLWNGSSYVAGGKSGRANTTTLNDYNAGGGGGAGNNGSSYKDGNAGVQINITGTNQFYAAGGGGGQYESENNINQGIGGSGIGGNGRIRASSGYLRNATSGVDGTGSGGGGGSYTQDPDLPAGSGGSGIVIIKVISPTTNKYLFFNYLPAQPTLNYTLNFPTRTMVNFNNSGDEVMNGQYTVSVRTTQSTITPTQGQNLQDRLYFTSNLAIRYHTLNPIKTDEGAQWTYSSSNANVYHLGSVGIGTTSPEYSLDVRGFIYSSSGGYTSSALTKWSVLSDRRIKENIVKASYDKCLENVKNIELYNFNFKENYVNTNDRHQLGFIAQEVQQVYPKAVEFSRMIMNLEEKIDDLLTLNTTQIDYTLYGAVKCLIQKLENIKIKMEQIKTVYNITT